MIINSVSFFRCPLCSYVERSWKTRLLTSESFYLLLRYYGDCFSLLYFTYFEHSHRYWWNPFPIFTYSLFLSTLGCRDVCIVTNFLALFKSLSNPAKEGSCLPLKLNIHTAYIYLLNVCFLNHVSYSLNMLFSQLSLHFYLLTGVVFKSFAINLLITLSDELANNWKSSTHLRS